MLKEIEISQEEKNVEKCLRGRRNSMYKRIAPRNQRRLKRYDHGERLENRVHKGISENRLKMETQSMLLIPFYVIAKDFQFYPERSGEPAKDFKQGNN